MRLFLFLLVILLSLGYYISSHTLFSGNTGYELKDNKVRYKYRKHYDSPWMHIKRVKKAHIPSFTIISGAYAKDSFKVYFQGEAIENSHPQSFEIHTIDQLLDRDKNQVYYWGEILSKDPENFEQLDKRYFRDAQHVWIKKKDPGFSNRFQFLQLTDTEATSFEIIRKGGFLSRTKTKVFYREKEIAGVNPQSVQALGGGYWQDIHRTYYQEMTLNLTDKHTLEVLKHPQGYFTLFAKDKTQVFYAGKPLEGVNAKNFQLVEREGHIMGFDGKHYVQIGGVIVK